MSRQVSPSTNQALLAGFRPDLVEGLPETQGTVAGGEFGVERKAVLVAQPQQELTPALGAFPEAVLDRQQLLAPLRVGADENQDALPILLEPGREVDPVGPDIDVAPGRQVAALPALL